jgi:Uma2 family endonuclease
MSEQPIVDSYKTEWYHGLRVDMMSEPALNHDIVVTNLNGLFYNLLKGKTCRNFVDGVSVHLPDTNSIVVPDALILCDRRKWHRDGIYGTPNLIVEVLSPATKKRDRGEKKDLYEKSNLGEYWIIDPESKEIEVYLLRDKKFYLDEVYRLPNKNDPDEYKTNAKTQIHMTLFPDASLDLREIFEDVVDWRDLDTQDSQ